MYFCPQICYNPFKVNKKGVSTVTNMQIDFLKLIYKNSMSAKEICKELDIEGDVNDPQGGYYNALNRAIDFLVYDDGSEIDGMFRIKHADNPVSDNDEYALTKEGRKFVENYEREHKK